ncbi:MAG: hypothetical protein H6737_05585 [Alphaproteobacteria bacterium]|nr:hypothetical protein [Alphaproteobacteria bacterium]
MTVAAAVLLLFSLGGVGLFASRRWLRPDPPALARLQALAAELGFEAGPDHAWTGVLDGRTVAWQLRRTLSFGPPDWHCDVMLVAPGGPLGMQVPAESLDAARLRALVADLGRVVDRLEGAG